MNLIYIPLYTRSRIQSSAVKLFYKIKHFFLSFLFFCFISKPKYVPAFLENPEWIYINKLNKVDRTKYHPVILAPTVIVSAEK